MRIIPKFLRPAPPPAPKPRPVISAPMNPRPYGHPIISAPINPRPFGLPDPNAGARRGLPEPVGPNAYKRLVEMDPSNADRYSPNYPVEYAYPFPTDGSRGLPTILSGPSRLRAGEKLEGPIDYANTGDIALRPDSHLEGLPAGNALGRSASVSRFLPGGAPPDAEGKPTLPHKGNAIAPPKLPSTPENPFGLPGPDGGPDLMRSVLGPD
ncbi:MAG: hypothetical protein JWP91_2989 [Fibrobacteres bacterium]|nr:hypothetical protein [Fibrobacterota bacterium]